MFNLDAASIAWAGTMADLLLKSALIFASAGLVTLAMSRFRASAAARHFVWLTAVAASLSLPLVSLVLPSWTVQLPAPIYQQQVVLSPSDTRLAIADTGTASLQSQEPAILATAATAVRPVAQTVIERPTDVVHAPQPAETAPIAWQSILLVAWLIGAAAALVPLAVGAFSLMRLRRFSPPIADERVTRVLCQLCRQYGIRRPVTLLATDRRQIPMTWGLRRPVVLLPDEATNWSDDKLRAVLLHELAHVQRCDCLAQWLGQLSRAVYWCNPLSWLAVWQLRNEQEQACDDQVLRSGLEAADYAEHLLAVVAARPRVRFAPGLALAMARSARIDRRLRTILDNKRARSSLSFPRASILAVAAIGLLVPLATVTITFDAQAQEQSSAKQGASEKKQSGQQISADRIAELRRTLSDQYVTTPDERRVIEGAIKGMVESLGDPYSEYLPAIKLADLQRQIEGKLTGIGAQLDMRDGQLTVVTPLEGSPALAAGVKPGDAILQIDDTSTRDLALADAVKRILGDAGTKVSLKVRRAGGDTADLTITRGPIVLRSISGFARDKEHRWQFMLNAEHKIGYLAASQLGPRTAEEIKEAVTALKKAGLNGLILDLRFCPGGLLQAAHDVASLFLGEATVVTIRGRDGKEQVMKSEGNNRLGDFPLVVLAGEQTASAAEVLTGALKDNNRAIVVGARTWGKGSVQSIIKFDEGAGAVRLTTAYFYSPGGRSIERKPGEKVWGVDPSDGYFVPMTQEAVDRLLELRKKRDIIGGEPAADGAHADQQSADAIARMGDAQLAAALRTLAAKVTAGEFEKVGQSAAAAQDYALRRRELQDRRAALTKSLEELDRQWKSLEN
jgi:carboxyl-terminal processing protease